MFLAVLLSAFLHEAGHAVCALVEGVTLNGFGLFLMVVYPGAYVDLDTETLLSKTHFQQLRIYCAGVSHLYCRFSENYFDCAWLKAARSDLCPDLRAQSDRCPHQFLRTVINQVQIDLFTEGCVSTAFASESAA